MDLEDLNVQLDAWEKDVLKMISRFRETMGEQVILGQYTMVKIRADKVCFIYL